jgi:hypothetical protein
VPYDTWYPFALALALGVHVTIIAPAAALAAIPDGAAGTAVTSEPDGVLALTTHELIASPFWLIARTRTR